VRYSPTPVSEPPFRFIAVGLVLAALAISTFYRARAERLASPLSERPPDRSPVAVVRVLGVAFWGLVLADPPWLGWSKVGIPTPLRWLGAFLGIALLFSTAWTFRSLGRNITSSIVTRTEHTLVTNGPYRWVRHPLYAAGLLLHVALALLLSSWLVALAGLATLGFIRPRIRREEAHLAARFGVAYEEYRRRSGSLLPRLHR
jgi:protein-S-isoprenylcysteine O-methyltransferase Ste14